jgi:hypothetical protein
MSFWYFYFLKRNKIIKLLFKSKVSLIDVMKFFMFLARFFFSYIYIYIIKLSEEKFNNFKYIYIYIYIYIIIIKTKMINTSLLQVMSALFE